MSVAQYLARAARPGALWYARMDKSFDIRDANSCRREEVFVHTFRDRAGRLVDLSFTCWVVDLWSRR